MFTSRFGFAASLAFVLSGCVVTSSSGSSGGDGGDDTGPASTPASSTASTASGSDGGGGFGVGGNEDGGAGVGGDISSTSVGGAPPGTGGAGSGGGPACGTCAEAITFGTETCEGVSSDLLTTLADCACADAGACFAVCGDNFCVSDSTPDCNACLQDTVAGCGNAFNACANDI